MAVNWGLAHRDIDGITAIGIDEICWRKRKDKFVTLVYQLDQGKRRLLWIGPDRTAKTFREFFDWLGAARSRQLRFICSDMWKPYLAVIAEKATGAVNILDRFHIMSHMSKAIDEVRADETKELKKKGKEPLLTKSRWCLLKRPKNLTEKQVDRLKDLLACNLRTVRAYLLKEDFQRFWGYSSPAWAGKFLDAWCTRTMRSKIKPMKKVAKMLRAHRPLLLNWFRAKNTIALGCVEGFNNKAKVVTKRSYGFRTYDGLKIALYHAIGGPTHTQGYPQILLTNQIPIMFPSDSWAMDWLKLTNRVLSKVKDCYLVLLNQKVQGWSFLSLTKYEHRYIRPAVDSVPSPQWPDVRSYDISCRL